MINILFPINKSVPPDYKYYDSFLHSLSGKLRRNNINVTYLLFSNNFYDGGKSRTLITGKNSKNNYKSISEFEKIYEFSFREILYTDLLQTSKFIHKTRGRNWFIPDSEFQEHENYKNKLNEIENLITSNKYTFVFADQTTDYEINFIKYVCKKNNLPFIRYLPNFMNRAFFASYINDIYGEILDITLEDIDDKIINNFINNFKNSNKKTVYNLNEKNLQPFFPQKIKSNRYKQLNRNFFLKVSNKLKDFYDKKIEKYFKLFLYDEFNRNKKYIYYGLHLTTESHIALHSYPYLNQINVIESISRALPYGYRLYVKPHPWWSHKIDLKSIKKIKKIPSVKIIHPNKPIKELIKNSKGVITLNATTGVEALILEKSVVALSNINGYTNYHPNAHLCSNLYFLHKLLNKLIH